MSDDSTSDAPRADGEPEARAERGPSAPLWTRVVPIGLFVGVLLLAALMVMTLPDESGPRVEPWTRGEDPRSFVAVMPFKDFSGSDSAAVLRLPAVLSAEFAGALARVDPERLGVLEARALVEDPAEPPALSRIRDALQVGYAVEGSVRVSGDRVRVEARLMDASSELMLWSDGWWCAYEELFEQLHRMAVTVASMFDVAPTARFPDEETRAWQGPERATSFAAYVDAVTHRANGEAELARQRLDAALGEDPHFVRARELRAELSLQQAREEPQRDEAWAQAEADARQALEWTEDAARAWLVLAAVLFERNRDATQARGAFQKAVELDAGRPAVHSAGVTICLASGETEAAVQHATAAMQLDPRDHDRRCALAWALLVAGEVDEARVEAGRVLLDSDQHPGALEIELLCLLAKGETEAARELAVAVTRPEPDLRARLEEEEPAQALQLLFTAIADQALLDPDRPHYARACALSRVGRVDEGLAELRRALEAREVAALGAASDPRTVALREAPGFPALWAELGLKGASR